MKDLATIVMFVYNRPGHTEKALLSLANNDLADQSTLIIYADGPKEDADQTTLKQIDKVRRLVKKVRHFRDSQVIERNNNLGLAKSIISGV